MQQSKALSLLLAAATAVFILTVCIALPILLRPFYYLHIQPLGLESSTGLSRAEIVLAYDSVMDFCIGRTEEFSAGPLPWSESGRDHFADVRELFLLDLYTALISGLLLLGWRLIRNRSCLQPYRFMKRSFSFWGCIGLCSVFSLVALLAALDFSRAFVLFHALFFPGRDNWLFDPYTDPIIRILPQIFFRNCAIFILSAILLTCAVLILRDLCRRKK